MSTQEDMQAEILLLREALAEVAPYYLGEHSHDHPSSVRIRRLMEAAETGRSPGTTAALMQAMARSTECWETGQPGVSSPAILVRFLTFNDQREAARAVVAAQRAVEPRPVGDPGRQALTDKELRAWNEGWEHAADAFTLYIAHHLGDTRAGEAMRRIRSDPADEATRELLAAARELRCDGSAYQTGHTYRDDGRLKRAIEALP